MAGVWRQDRAYSEEVINRCGLKEIQRLRQRKLHESGHARGETERVVLSMLEEMEIHGQGRLVRKWPRDVAWKRYKE